MKDLKRNVVSIGLVVLFLTGGGMAFAADTDSITLTGTVASILELSIADQAGFDALVLTADGVDVNVAIVTVECNDSDGYTVTMVTTNGLTGGLFTSADSDETLDYSVKYNGSLVTFTGGSGEAESTSVRSTVDGDPRDIEISWTAPVTELAAAEYTDTLTLTIAAN